MAIFQTAREALALYEREVDELQERQLEACILYFAEHPEQIEKRLNELDEEWDVDRVTEAELGLTALTGLLAGFYRGNRRYLGALAAGLMAYHGIKGKSPVGLAYRGLGFRTMEHIDRERFALKALRGDFEGLEVEQEPDCLDRARKALASSY